MSQVKTSNNICHPVLVQSGLEASYTSDEGKPKSWLARSAGKHPWAESQCRTPASADGAVAW